MSEESHRPWITSDADITWFTKDENGDWVEVDPDE